MIEKYRVTAAHKNTLNILKGYPNAITEQELLFSCDGSILAIDGSGHRLYPNDDVITHTFGQGPFDQSIVAVERSTANEVEDSGFQDVGALPVNWATSPAGGYINPGDSNKPVDFAGSSEDALHNDGFAATTAITYAKGVIFSVNAGQEVVQQCWVKTDASAVRFSVYSSVTGHHYDDYTTINPDRWQYVDSTPYTVQAGDIVGTGDEIRQFHVESSGNATYMNIFRPQTEVYDFPTSWIDNSRADGVLAYSNSYFTPRGFSTGGWFRVKNFDGDRNAFFSICNDHGNNSRLVAFTDNAYGNKLVIQGADANNQLFDIDTSYDIEENEWIHLVITYDSIRYRIYINGTLDTAVTDGRNLKFEQDALLYLGTWYDQDFLNGNVSYFVISSRVFTDHLVEHIHANDMPWYNPYYYIGQV